MITTTAPQITGKAASCRISPLARLLLAACALLISTGSARALQVGIQHELPDSEYQALLDLYNSAGGSGWSNNQGWPDPAASWQGVTIEGVERDGNGDVTTKGHVTHLALGRSSLNGTLPASLGNLTQLSYLSLESNQLRGPIPSTLGGLTPLIYINLSDNRLTGGIPASFGNLPALDGLYLNDNKLSGRIPTQLGNLSQLKILNLFNNSLTGTIPSALGGMDLIEDMDFGVNLLEGVIPANFIELDHLTSLSLFGNNFEELDPKSPFMKSRQPLINKGVSVPVYPQRHRIIALTGDLAFGSVKVNSKTQRTLTIANTGDFAMKVTRLKLPAGFSGNFTGTIKPGKKKTVVVTFKPAARKNYSGKVTVVSDASSGKPTLKISGTGK